MCYTQASNVFVQVMFAHNMLSLCPSLLVGGVACAMVKPGVFTPSYACMHTCLWWVSQGGHVPP